MSMTKWPNSSVKSFKRNDSQVEDGRKTHEHIKYITNIPQRGKAALNNDIHCSCAPNQEISKGQTDQQELWRLAKRFPQKCCDCEGISNDDKERHYAKERRPEGIPLVEVHSSTKCLNAN